MLMTTSVMQELTCMDAGWEIGANQMMSHVQCIVPTQCHLNVMKIAIPVTWDGPDSVGMEITVSQWGKNVL